MCIALIVGGCDEQGAIGTPRFAIFLVDDSIAASAQQGPAGAERVPESTADGGAPGALWLKREGGMVGPYVADARVIATPDGQPAVEFVLTPQGRDMFAALTRANIGRRLAVVVNGAVVAASIIGAEMADGRAMISGSYTEAEAQELAGELIATRQR
jgi:preprotein translocase subunit SecD